MKRDSLDLYDTLPVAMVSYLKHYGRHFNSALLNFALSKMTMRIPSTGRVEQISPYNKEQVDNILKAYNVKLENNELYDYVYVANMCKADFLGSSIKDEKSLALYVKDVIDDVDGYDGIVFNRWYADMCRKGIPIEWNDFI